MNLLQNNETQHLGVLKGRPYHIGGFNLRPLPSIASHIVPKGRPYHIGGFNLRKAKAPVHHHPSEVSTSAKKQRYAPTTSKVSTYAKKPQIRFLPQSAFQIYTSEISPMEML